MQRKTVEDESDFIVDFREVEALPAKLDFRKPGPYERTLMHLWLNKTKWFEIFAKEDEDEATFTKHRGGLATKGVTIIQRTHSDKSKHFYMKWELRVSPEQYNRMGYSAKKAERAGRPRHD